MKYKYRRAELDLFFKQNVYYVFAGSERSEYNLTVSIEITDTWKQTDFNEQNGTRYAFVNYHQILKGTDICQSGKTKQKIIFDFFLKKKNKNTSVASN